MTSPRALVLVVLLGLGAIIGVLVATSASESAPAPAPDWPDPTWRRTAGGDPHTAPAAHAAPRQDHAPGARAAPPAPAPRLPGARLHGRVVTPMGAPAAGVRLRLVDADGAPLDEVTSGADGAYRLTDDALAARAVLVVEDSWPLRPLAPREDRALDLVHGPTREVRGFVLDLEGEPVAGVPVALRAMRWEAPAWPTLSDARGAFRLVAPTTAGVVEANGLDLGVDRAWVGEGEVDVEVELVLEPVATLTILTEPDPDTGLPPRVTITASDPKAFGPDRSWEPLQAELTEVTSAIEERRTRVAAGRSGDTFTLPANVWYWVTVELEPRLLHCGSVTLQPGEERTFRCGGGDLTTHVSGRVVDRRGAPIGNLQLWYEAFGNGPAFIEEHVLVGADGRFAFEVTHDRPVTMKVGIGARDDGRAVRQSVVLLPGEDAALGDVLYMVDEARPDPWPDAAYGGIGGLVTFDEDGVTLLDMEDDSPLYLAGVDKGDTIILVDGRPANEMPDEEALVLLRGEPGSWVTLRLRSHAGDLYDLTLERKLMGAPDATWADGGASRRSPTGEDEGLDP